MTYGPGNRTAYQAALKKYYYTVAVRYRIALLKIREMLPFYIDTDEIDTLVSDVLEQIDKLEKPRWVEGIS